jgi:hypothetical protein
VQPNPHWKSIGEGLDGKSKLESMCTRPAPLLSDQNGNAVSKWNEAKANAMRLYAESGLAKY